MPLEGFQTDGSRFGNELLLQLFCGEAEGDVHGRAVGGIGRAAVEVGGVDGRIQLTCLSLVAGEDVFQSFTLEPACDEAEHVDGEAGRGVVERVLADMGGVAKHRGNGFGCLLRPCLVDDDQCAAGRSQILLETSVDESELARIERARENVRGHISDQWDIGRGELGPSYAFNGLVRGDVEIGGHVGRLYFILCRHAGGGYPCGICGDVDVAEEFSLLDGFLCPGTGVGVVGALIGSEQVHGNHGELGAGSALQEEDRLIVGNIHKLCHIGGSLFMDGRVLLAAMAALHDGHAAALEIDEIALCLLQNFEREYCGSGAEVIDACHCCTRFPRIERMGCLGSFKWAHRHLL